MILNCQSLHYFITSNCGLCPNTTTMTTIKCRGISVGEQCELSVQSEVCDSVVGNASSVLVNLKGIHWTVNTSLRLAIELFISTSTRCPSDWRSSYIFSYDRKHLCNNNLSHRNGENST